MASIKKPISIKRVIKPAKTTDAKAKATQPPKQDAKPKAAPKAEKPTVAMHQFATAYDGPSTGLNTRVSRTPVQIERFGSLLDAPMTDRDQKNLEAIRKEFGSSNFERRNIDTGILKRLGERGCLVHVAGTAVDPKATFKLTAKGLGRPEPRARKAG